MFAFTMRFPGHGRESQPSGIPFRRFGGFGEGETPGPIPNPKAKPFSADGTALETVWESRTPPDLNQRKRHPNGVALSHVRGNSAELAGRGPVPRQPGASGSAKFDDGGASWRNPDGE